MTRRGALVPAIAVALMLGACDIGGVTPDGPQAAPEVGAPGPEQAFGPILVLDVVNNSNADVEAGYEYRSDNPSGSGETVVPACHHVSTFFGEVAGTYTITIDGEVVAEGVIPRGVRDGAVRKRVIVAPDGTARAVGGLPWTETVPDDFVRLIGDCP